jgi:hypothetical protein
MIAAFVEVDRLLAVGHRRQEEQAAAMAGFR